MSVDDTLSELHDRLDNIEARLEAKAAKARAKGPLATHRERELAEVRAHATAMRDKLHGAKAPDWETVKQDLEADWEALTNSFERWVERLDAD